MTDVQEPPASSPPQRTWRDLDLPAKLRLRWRLKARPKQLTPKRHYLCSNPPEVCDYYLAQVLLDIPDEAAARAWLSWRKPDLSETDPRDWLGEARLDWLALAGHYDWLIWVILAGRGWGKSRTGAEDIVKFMLEHPGCRTALVGATYADGRDTMVEGESGILGILPSPLIADWNRSIGELVLTNGSRAKIFTSVNPERLRGPQHHRVWADELAAWTYQQETWDMMMFGLRLGENPQVVVTTTPKPIKFLRKLLDRSKNPMGGVVVTSGSTYENAANLARAALQELKETYEGTRMGRQELHAEVLTELEGSLFAQADIDRSRLALYQIPDISSAFHRVVVGVDPSVTSGENSDDTGIITVGLTHNPCPFCVRATQAHAVVLEDATVGGSSNAQWANVVSRQYEKHGADRVIAETNNGGDLVVTVLQATHPNLPVKKEHASRGKVARAEPISALYERGLVHHLGSTFEKLEDQMTTYTGESGQDSPDRMDALVWAITNLMVPARRTRKTGTARDTRQAGRR